MNSRKINESFVLPWEAEPIYWKKNASYFCNFNNHLTNYNDEPNEEIKTNGPRQNS